MSAMRDHAFHRAREIQELARAGVATDAAVKIAHYRLAAMHAAKAAKARLIEESKIETSEYVVRDLGIVSQEMPTRVRI
jgi:hypothetical protein